MAQTTDAITFEDCKVEISSNGTAWTDASGFASRVQLSGGERQTGEKYTFDGEFAIVRRGKAQPMDIQIDVVYTEGAAEPYQMCEDAYVNGTDLWARWSPKGGTIGDKQFTTDPSVLVSPPFPVGEAGNGEPVMFTLNLKCQKVTVADVT